MLLALPGLRLRPPGHARRVPGMRVCYIFNESTDRARDGGAARRVASTGMSSTDLTMEQRQALFHAAVDRRDWCGNVVKRAKELNWAEDDPVSVAAAQAQEALQAMVKAVAGSGPINPPMPRLASRGDVMAARKRGLPEP